MRYVDQFRARLDAMSASELRDLVAEIEREYAKVSLDRQRLQVRVNEMREELLHA